MNEMIHCDHEQVIPNPGGAPGEYCFQCGAVRGVEHLNIGEGWFTTEWSYPRKVVAEIERLRAALQKYGEHKIGCAWYFYDDFNDCHMPCTCGLDEALE